MLFFLILGLLLGATSVVFALQNVTVVTVTFFTWQAQGSLSIILLLALMSGVLVCILISIPEIIKGQVEYSGLRATEPRTNHTYGLRGTLCNLASGRPNLAQTIYIWPPGDRTSHEPYLWTSGNIM